jgi:DCN1-like protein 4/5
LFHPAYLRIHPLILVFQDYTTSYSVSTTVPKAASVSSKKSKTDPYTAHRALELFKAYADEDVPDVINPEGFERLCKDADMPLEGARPLVFSWQVQAKEMGKISKSEWVQGMSTLKSVLMH